MPIIKLFPGDQPWSTEDAAALRQFIVSATGQRFLSKLFSLRPEVTSLEPVTRQIRNDERAGYENAIATTLALAEPDRLTANDLRAHSETVKETTDQAHPHSI